MFFFGMFLVFLAFFTLGLYSSFLGVLASDSLIYLNMPDFDHFNLIILNWWLFFPGEYFGLLYPERQRRFPYNILRHPMYVGSTMAFFGYALV